MTERRITEEQRAAIKALRLQLCDAGEVMRRLDLDFVALMDRLRIGHDVGPDEQINVHDGTIGPRPQPPTS